MMSSTTSRRILPTQEAAFFSRTSQLEESALKKSLQVLVTTVAVSLGANIANAQQADPRVADLVRAGKVRGALFLPQYTTDPVSGELRGAAGGVVMIALAHALAARVGVEVLLVGHPTPAQATQC